MSPVEIAAVCFINGVIVAVWNWWKSAPKVNPDGSPREPE